MKKFAKWLVMILVVSCICALTLFATGCGNKDKSVKSVTVNDKGEIVAVYDDNTTATLGKVGLIKSAEMKDGKFVLTLTDGKTVECAVAAAAKTVVSIKTVGNELEVTYSTGDVEKISLGANVTCEHKNAVYTEQVPHKMNADGKTFTNGIYLELCPDCGYTKTISDVIHTYVKTPVPATCTEKGYSVQKCACGLEGEKTDYVDALGHKMDVRPVHADENWCEEGGLSVEVCARCNLIGEYKTITKKDAPGHHSDKWTIKKPATYADAGILEGLCKVCGEVKTRVLPACSDAAYTVSNVTPENASCSTETKGTFTIEIDGQKIAVENVVIPGVKHILNGETIDDGKEIVFTSKEALEKAGYKLMGNAKAFTCAEATAAYFTCDKCKEIIAVSVRKRHASDGTVDDVVEVAATCENPGKLKIKCAICNKNNEGFSYEEIPALGHNYVYEWNEETKVMTGVCSNYSTVQSENKCNHPFDNYRDLDDVKAEVIKEATCQEAGLTKYTLYKGDEIKVINAVSKKLDHNLERADGTTKRIPEGEKLLRSAYPEIKKFGNAVESCKASFGGYFTCKDCNELIDVTLYIPHTVKEGTERKISVATCLKDGIREFDCAVCKDANGQPTYVTNDVYQKALGHDYKWEVIEKGDEDEFYHLRGTCQREYDGVKCTEDPEDTVANKDLCHVRDYPSTTELKYEVLAEATCSKEGLVQYTINDTELVNVVVPKLHHTLNGVKIDDTKVVPSTTKGVKLFGNTNTKLACSGDGVGGYFTCEVCKEIISITVNQPHTKPATLPADATKAASCEEYGTITYDCAVCGNKVIETIAPEGHILVATATYNQLTDVITVTMKCTRTHKDAEDKDVVCGKTFTKVIEDGRNFKNIKTYGFKLVEDVKATCANEGHKSYSFTIKDYEYPVTVASVKYNNVTRNVTNAAGEIQYEEDSVTPKTIVVKVPEVVVKTDKIRVTLNCTVSYVLDKLAHKFVQTESKDVDDNIILDADGKPVMIDKIFTFEVVEKAADGTEKTYIVSVKICKDCGKVVEVDKEEKNY